MTTDNEHLAHAKYLGADAAMAFASWVEMTDEMAESVLTDVDPEVMDAIREPNLSGEFADDPTPESVYIDVTGEPDASGATDAQVEAISDAWEAGRDEVWNDALQAIALRTLGRTDEAFELEGRTEAKVRKLRKAYMDS